jgi:magnesium chelatase family protein
MIIKTLFQHEGRFALGEVEVKLLPGIPQLQVVGMPDAHIRECGLRLKSALRSCSLQWPRGHQIVVNLRPSYFRKSSSGVDLAIALGFLALTGQLPEGLQKGLTGAIVFGEVALDGRVFAPSDLSRALHAAPEHLITGEGDSGVRDGSWRRISKLNDGEFTTIRRNFDWPAFWCEPELPDLELRPKAFQALVLAAHMRLNVLIGGPPGSGKSTWARLLHGLTTPPEPACVEDLREMFGDEVLESRWRPCEFPHHTITTQAMIGGGSPIFPGVITRAHGGILVMDEFLEFNQDVLESLREPVECGYIEHVRRGERGRFPARFQLIGTTNLCRCGKLEIGMSKSDCSRPLLHCRSVCTRLSGPVLDRFDLFILSHDWLSTEERIPAAALKLRLKELREFALARGEVPVQPPDYLTLSGYSHRRRQSMLRVARGLADMENSVKVTGRHFFEARQWVLKPLEDLALMFG